MCGSRIGLLLAGASLLVSCGFEPKQVDNGRPPAPTGGNSGAAPAPAGTGGAAGGPAAPQPPGGTGGSAGAPGAGGSGGAPRVDAGRRDGRAPDAGARPADAGRGADRPAAADVGAPARAIPPTGYSCPAGPFGDPLPANRTATLIKANAGSLEGPLWLAEQDALVFCVVSGVPGMGRIDKYVPATSTFSTFAMGVDVAGLALSPMGAIVAASFDSRNLTQFNPGTAARSSIPGTNVYNGKPFNQTNDLVVRSDGNIYFTDTNYRQDGRPGQETTAYYRYSPAGQITRLGAGPQPNGIALAPDGRVLYVSSSEGDPVRRFVLDEDGGVVGTPTVFTNAGSDGMAIDCAGNVYITTGGTVRVLAPDGRVIGSIMGLGGSTVSNAAFGGPDRKTLFITTASALYRIELNVPGFPS